ncbi:MAG: hypothetical protein ACOH5I_22040 [Oligoflexus sp.]
MRHDLASFSESIRDDCLFSELAVSVDSNDPLLAILREGARKLLTQALEAEVADYIAKFSELRDDAGRRMVVRNGHHPERTIQTGLGDIQVKQPKVNDKRYDENGQHIPIEVWKLPEGVMCFLLTPITSPQ